MSDTPTLRTRGLVKRFGNLVVTDDVSFELAVGERRAVIGPNGAGKTSLVGLLSGTLRCDAGTIELAGEAVTHMAPAARVRRGLVRTFQITSIFRDFSVLENLFLARSEQVGASRGLWRSAASRTDVIEACEAILVRLGLADDRHRTVSEISYGKQRLIEVGLALCLDPRVLILDEPAAGLPHDEAERLLDIIGQLPADLAILMIEHDMEIVKRFASRITVLVRGRELMTGTPEAVLSSPEVREVYLGHVEALDVEGALDA